MLEKLNYLHAGKRSTGSSLDQPEKVCLINYDKIVGINALRGYDSDPKYVVHTVSEGCYYYITKAEYERILKRSESEKDF